jgi:hypothetical protein
MTGAALGLRLAVAVGGLVPVLGGLDGILEGSGMADGLGARSGLGAQPGLDSHVRYLSGLLLAVGLGFWSTIPHIERQGVRFRMLTLVVVTGGLARLAGTLVHGLPPAPMAAALGMELAVTPLLCAWQALVARRATLGAVATRG